MNSLLSWMTATFGGVLTREALAFVISMVPSGAARRADFFLRSGH